MISEGDGRSARRCGRPGFGRSGCGRPVLVAVTLLALAVLGCDSGGATALTVELVDGAGLNPVSRIDRGVLTLRVTQVGAIDVIQTAAVSGGTFDVAIPIASYSAVTTIEVTVEDDGSPRTLVGATIPFVPSGYGRVRVVVGEPGTCIPISSPHLPVPLDSPALVLNGVNLLVFGGRSDSAPGRSNVHALSPIDLTLPASPVIDLGLLTVPMGRSRGASLGPPYPTFNVLVLADSGSIVYDAAQSVTGARDTPLALAPGANADAAIVELGELGAAVVGGDRVTFVSREGTVTRTSMLLVPRTRAAAARLGDGILVAGGAATGEVLFEWHRIGSDDVRPFGAGLAQRVDASLAVSPTNDAALFLLGRSPDDDSLASGSLIVSGCPSACAARIGPDVPTLRSGAVAAARVRLSAIDRPPTTLLLGGDTDSAGLIVPSGAVDSVSWDGGTPSLDAERGLVTPRSGLAALPLGASVVLVGGGTGPTRVLDDLELCF